jgi:hypothetical protein
VVVRELRVWWGKVAVRVYGGDSKDEGEGG